MYPVLWFVLSASLPVALKGQAPCTPTVPRLSYPAPAMERKVSGPVRLIFSIDGRGAPRDLEASGDPLLTSDVKFAFRYVQLPRQCSGRHLSILITFRINSELPLETPVAMRQISETEYEVVSPAKNVVVISDPQLTWTRPRAVPVQVWRVGDDGLTLRLGDALESAFNRSRDFTPGSGEQPGTLIVSVPKHVGWKEFGERTQVQYEVDFTTADGMSVGRSEGRCWEDALEKCATQILTAAKRAVRKMPPL